MTTVPHCAQNVLPHSTPFYTGNSSTDVSSCCSHTSNVYKQCHPSLTTGPWICADQLLSAAVPLLGISRNAVTSTPLAQYFSFLFFSLSIILTGPPQSLSVHIQYSHSLRYVSLKHKLREARSFPASQPMSDIKGKSQT